MINHEPFDIDGELKVTLLMNFTIHDGKLRGLSSLTNITETKTVCKENNTIVMFNTTLRMRNAEVFYNWTRSGFLLTQEGTFWIKADVMDFYIEIVLNMTDQKKVTYNVVSTLLAKPEDVKMKFEGLGFLDYGVNALLRTMFRFFKGKLKIAIESIVKHIVDQKVYIIVKHHNNPLFS